MRVDFSAGEALSAEELHCLPILIIKVLSLTLLFSLEFMLIDPNNFILILKVIFHFERTRT